MITGLYSYPPRPWQAMEPDDVVLAELLKAKGVNVHASCGRLCDLEDLWGRV